MAEIHYSLAGEGRGHATRARTLVEELREQHRVTIHTFGDAYDMLAALYCGSEVEVRRIPGARFRYDRRGKLDLFRTALANAGLVGGARGQIADMARRLERDGAELVLTDFEPLLPRAARAAGLPVVAIDHQSALAHGDFSALRPALRRHARMLGAFVRAWVPAPNLQISSSFYVPPAREDALDVHFIGVLLRRQLRDATPSLGEHLVAYLRRTPSEEALDALARLDVPVRLYGPSGVRARGALQPRAIAEGGFIDDLVSCSAVITTAGNQLVGEALHLGKPVLAMPEPGNREQEINAWFLEDTGAGRATTFDALGRAALDDFLAEGPRLRERAEALEVDGTGAALQLIEEATACV